MNAHLARLKSLEKHAAPEPDKEPVMFVPANGTEPEGFVDKQWEEYRRTGRSESGIVILPRGVEVTKLDDGRTLFTIFDDNFYGNAETIKERVAQREADIAAGRFVPTPWENPEHEAAVCVADDPEWYIRD